MITTNHTAEKPIIAAFDYDGTLTTRDTLISFLRYTTGFWPTVGKLACLSPVFLGYLCKIIPRQHAKEMVLTRFFTQIPIAYLRELGALFSRSQQLLRLVRAPLLARLRWHQQQGHRCILISASLDIYLEPWAKSVGFHDVIASCLEISPEGNVTGKLKGLNCWGPEKIRRLQELVGPKESYTLYAYGNSLGDQDLLAIADYPYYRLREF